MTTNQIKNIQNNQNAENNSRNLLLEAQESAMSAKEIAMAAVSRISEGRTMNKLDETLAKILDEAEQHIKKQTGQNQTSIPEPYDKPFPDEPIDIYPEIKRKTENPEIKRRRQLEQLIQELAEEKAQKKIERINEEAGIYKMKAQQALDEAEAIRKAARTAINQAKQEALGQAEEEISQAWEESRLVKYAAYNAVRQAQEEARRYREEAETANNDARLAISLAQERVKAASEEIEAIQQQAQADAGRARADILRAKEEAEIARRESRKAISGAEAESRQIREEAETGFARVNERLLRAKQHVVNLTREDLAETGQALGKAIKPEPGDNPDIAKGLTYQHLLDKLTEMHNPLHAISGFARMILDDTICDTAAEKEFVRTILQQSESLKLQLDDINRLLKVNNEE